MLPSPEHLIVTLARIVADESGIFFDRAAQEKLEKYLENELVSYVIPKVQLSTDTLIRIELKINHRIIALLQAERPGPQQV